MYIGSVIPPMPHYQTPVGGKVKQLNKQKQPLDKMVDYLNTKVKKQEKMDYINTDQLKLSGSKLESIHLGYQHMKSLESMHQGQLDAQKAQLEQFQNLTNQCSAIQEELNLERENCQRIIAGQKAIDYPEDSRFLTKLSNGLWGDEKGSK